MIYAIQALIEKIILIQSETGMPTISYGQKQMKEIKDYKEAILTLAAHLNHKEQKS